MQVFEVEVAVSIYVSVESGGSTEAENLARRFVAQDWLLRSVETYGRAYGRAVVKGLSGDVRSCVPFVGNRKISSAVQPADDSAELPEIF